MERRIVDSVHVGDNTGTVPSELHTIRCSFHNFLSLPNGRGKQTESPTLLCHGHSWSIIVCPGGNTNSNESIVQTSVFLRCKDSDDKAGRKRVRVKFTLRMPGADVSRGPLTQTLSQTEQSWGFPDYASRVDILDPTKRFLVDGALTVEADVQVYMTKPPSWKPPNTLHDDMIRMLESSSSSSGADVIFEIEETKFPAHRNILKFRAPTLAALAEEVSHDTPIPIHGVTPSTFQYMLRFIYGNELPSPSILQNEASVLLEAADRFGCTGLKLAAESELADCGITVENAADLLLLADARSCPLLREAAIHFFTVHKAAVMKSKGWDKVRESAPILSELLDITFACTSEPVAAGGLPVNNNTEEGGEASSTRNEEEENDIRTMHVATLRDRLADRGLDVDGTKEMLVRRLLDAMELSSSSD